ncbi:hypothetical protein NW766_009575 [Fusarium irregulare]|uniref:Uncharacterized protein n=1 Tax=Fusarium irregulare TaxID=2494466 RepID=A0A9W8U745_9HYPO|nr:hypothetical protein NW766_009575 [Fusarium irregulare]
MIAIDDEAVPITGPAHAGTSLEAIKTFQLSYRQDYYPRCLEIVRFRHMPYTFSLSMQSVQAPVEAPHSMGRMLLALLREPVSTTSPIIYVPCGLLTLGQPDLTRAAAARQQPEPISGKESDVTQSFNARRANLTTLRRQSPRAVNDRAISIL